MHIVCLTLFACRYGNPVTAPAASNLLVKVPGPQRDQGNCIFDTEDETTVHFTAQEAGEYNHPESIRGKAFTAV